MNDLKIIGKQVLNNIEMKIIEGGFGENQKCMLVSDIAMQHQVEQRTLNVLIKNNIERFTKNDLLDFLNPLDGLREFAKENGLITNNRVQNIFLLPERGYTKLVAMMDNTNEKKWEVMDKLIDGYFKMREAVKSDNKLFESDEDYFIYQLQEQKKMKEQLNQINKRAIKNENEINNLPLLTIDSKELKKYVNRKAVELLGGKATDAYKNISKKVFSDMYREIWR